MHCLVVTILCCVDDHFTSFVTVLLLLLTMVCSEFCCIICAVPRKNSLPCISDRLSISASFQHHILENIKNLISVHL